jgi:hypothetical protein
MGRLTLDHGRMWWAHEMRWGFEDCRLTADSTLACDITEDQVHELFSPKLGRHHSLFARHLVPNFGMV